MPDDEDYRAFFHLVEHPEGWSTQDRATMELYLQQQRQAVEAAHPKDRKGRDRLQRIVDSIEAAIAVHDDLKSG